MAKRLNKEKIQKDENFLIITTNIGRNLYEPEQNLIKTINTKFSDSDFFYSLKADDLTQTKPQSHKL